MSYCAHSWLCCELFCSQQSKLSHPETKRNAFLLLPDTQPLEQPCYSVQVISASQELLGLRFSAHLQIQFFPLITQSSRDRSFCCVPTIEGNLYLPNIIFNERFTKQYMKKQNFFCCCSIFVLLKKQSLQPENSRAGKQIQAAEEEQHHLIFSTTLFMHEYLP